MDPTTKGLAQIAGQEHDDNFVTLRADEGEPYKVEIKKIRTRQFVAIFKKIDELADAGVVKLTDETGAFVFTAKGIFTQFSELKLFLRGGDPALDIVAIVSGLPREEIDDLDLLDLAKVIGKSWEVNERFFVRNQAELKEALGPIWTIAEKFLNTLKEASEKQSPPSEPSPDSLTNLSPEDTEPSNKSSISTSTN